MQNKLEKIKRKLEEATWKDAFEILFHPFLLPFSLIPAWVKSIWAARVLLWGQWSRYHGFHAQNAINNMFYRTQWININRYGRLACSPIIGLGNFPLSNWWHLSSFASYFYANAGAVTTLLGTLVLVFFHLVWCQSINPIWVSIVTIVLFFSSTMYAMAFSRQNYQILAWMFLPIIFYGLLNGKLVVATLALLFSSIFGITAFVVSSLFVLVASFDLQQPYLMITLLPSVFAVIFKFIPLFISGNFKKSLLSVGKLIGLVRVKVRYKRTSMAISIFNFYFMLLYLFGLVLIWYGKCQLPVYLLVSYLLFLFNQRFLRFADEESIIIVVSLAATLEVLTSSLNLISLLGLIVIVNPLACTLQVGTYARAKTFKPFDIENLLTLIRNFLDVPKHSKVYFAFNDPSDTYEKIFDGYRVLMEAPLLVSAEKEIHTFPDWYAVQETNYSEAPRIWGRSIKEVIENMRNLQAGYAIIYQDNTQIDDKWLNSFDLISTFSWKDYSDYLDDWDREYLFRNFSPPIWYLLKLRN